MTTQDYSQPGYETAESLGLDEEHFTKPWAMVARASGRALHANGEFGYATRTLADRLQGASFSELEEFVADILRRRVLGGPDAVMKDIVRSRLGQWKARAAARAENR